MSETEKFDPVGLVLLLRLSSCGHGYHLWIDKKITDTYHLGAGDMLKVKLLGVMREFSESRILRKPGDQAPLQQPGTGTTKTGSSVKEKEVRSSDVL